MRIICLLRGHRVKRIGIPALFYGDPDLGTVCICRRCRHSWIERTP